MVPDWTSYCFSEKSVIDDFALSITKLPPETKFWIVTEEGSLLVERLDTPESDLDRFKVYSWNRSTVLDDLKSLINLPVVEVHSESGDRRVRDLV